MRQIYRCAAAIPIILLLAFITTEAKAQAFSLKVNEQAFKDIDREIRTMEMELNFPQRSFKVDVETALAYESRASEFAAAYVRGIFPKYEPGTRPPAGFIEAEKAIYDETYWVDKKDKKDIIAGCQYFILKAFGDSLERKITLYALDGSTLRVGVSIFEPPGNDQESGK